MMAEASFMPMAHPQECAAEGSLRQPSSYVTYSYQKSLVPDVPPCAPRAFEALE